MPLPIVLGSSSRWRQQLMREWGYQFEVVNPYVDEKLIRREDPEVLTQDLAIVKSQAVRERLERRSLVITSDQVVVVGGITREKPTTADEARMFLRSYRSLPAECVTSVYAYNTKTARSMLGTDRAKVYFRGLTIEAVERIIDEGVIFSCAGGFAAGHPSFEPYIDRIEGTRDSVMGFPRHLVDRFLRALSADD